jgi:hypothetical protein
MAGGCSFSAEMNAWWEWFLTTITDVGSTELIAVENRSHKIFKLVSGSKKNCRPPLF